MSKKTESALHNRVKAARVRLGLSQQELAHAAGVTRQTIGGIESGLYKPSAAAALRLARTLGCRVEDLFWLEEEPLGIEALPAQSVPVGRPVPLILAEVGGQWVAHSLDGDRAFREDMIPTDGVGAWHPQETRLRAELMDDPRNLAKTAVLAGCTPALSLWARAAERRHMGLRVHWSFANSMQALHSLSRGEVHAAGLHLSDPIAGEDNTAHVRAVLGRRPAVLVNLGVWDEGFVVAAGNPRQLKGGGDLARPDVRLVNREEGSGSRALLESLLNKHRIAPADVRGYDRLAYSHLAVAREVAAGAADCGISSACVATTYGLGFVPLRSVRYDLAIRTEYLEELPVRQLLATLDNRWIRAQLRRLAGYDTARTGEIVAEVAPGT